eukprot:CAMPEP_0117651454 /NCGR_PEP_ID=MMETSP0804-20121206/2102_1 /TAXON_ID=1074897 /ORGANISM="Tetraselmis astigmatica, Strain CCMP880" /LENGTH=572 /DNA_ID=CAMNT_0005457435 /DNA_START=52 /DNA_END=1771 /DNA_ORIENTATION=+
MTKTVDEAPAHLNLSRRYEERLLRQAFSKSGPVPALILTGFLGSGKTTVVNHILQTRGNLRVAVLVNEVGELDVDYYLSAQARTMQQWDYLVLETSGAADPAPMAEVLLQHGFHLDAVATVVDAEAAHIALGMQTGKAQLEAADLIVINKCDLVGLRQLADLEDNIARIAPSIRVVRTRFGQAPLESIMDVQEVAPSADAKSLQGELGVLSHDTLPTVGKKWQVGGMCESASADSAPARKKARLAERAGGGGDGASTEEQKNLAHPPSQGGHHDHSHHSHGSHFHHHSPHRVLHQSEVQSVSICSDQAISLAKLQEFVVKHLVGSTGVFRAKGLLRLADRRGNRTVFHFHGLHRFEVLVMGPWESPPCCQLVIIGKDLQALKRIKRDFETSLSDLPKEGSGAADPTGASARSREVVRELGALVKEHQRFDVSPASCSPGVLGFSAVGVPLKSIEAAVVNAAVMRAVNNSGRMLVAGEVGTEAVFHGTGAQQRSRVGALLLPVSDAELPGGEEAGGARTAHDAAAGIWEQVLDAARGALTVAFRHAGGCSCDIGDALRAMAEAREKEKQRTPV